MASKRGLLDLGVALASATAGYYFYSRNEFWFGQPNNPDPTRNPSDFDKTFAGPWLTGWEPRNFFSGILGKRCICFAHLFINRRRIKIAEDGIKNPLACSSPKNHKINIEHCYVEDKLLSMKVGERW